MQLKLNRIRLIYGNYELDPVKKYETPYGMKFEWTMLTDGAKLIVHLKDKQKIRNRKRWSQVNEHKYQKVNRDCFHHTTELYAILTCT